MKKKILCILLAAVMVMSMTTGALAAGDEATEAQGLRLELTESEGTALLQVYLTAEGLTNGRLVVSYDAAKLTLAEAAVGDESWVTSLNTETAGEVGFAWAGSDLPAEETLMLTLTFSEVSEGSSAGAVYTAEVEESYNSGTAVTVEPGEAQAESSQGSDVPVVPTTPTTPTTPTAPTEPDEPEGSECPFVDIDGHWAEDDIVKAYNAGLVKGTTDTTFSPDATVTRAMFVTLLYRLEGEPAVSGETPFTDVADGAYYEDAVAWAYSTQVVKGTSETAFSPDDVITREQLVTMLYRYAEYTGHDTSSRDSLTAFSDASDVSAWALDAVQWAVAEGIIQGYNGILSPAGNSTRAQATTILVRYAGL